MTSHAFNEGGMKPGDVMAREETTQKEGSTITGALTRRVRSDVRVLFDANASPPQRRRALAETAGATAAGLALSTTGVDLLVHNPAVVNVLTSTDGATGLIIAGSTLGLSGMFTGMYAAMDGGLEDSERRGFRSFFHGVRTVGYGGAAAIGVTAAAFAGLGAEHLLPAAGGIADVGGAVAAGFAGLGVGGHVMQRALTRRSDRTVGN